MHRFYAKKRRRETGGERKRKKEATRIHEFLSCCSAIDEKSNRSDYDDVGVQKTDFDMTIEGRTYHLFFGGCLESIFFLVPMYCTRDASTEPSDKEGHGRHPFLITS